VRAGLRPVSEPPRHRPQSLTIRVVPLDRDDHDSEHELAAEEEGNRRQAQEEHRLPELAIHRPQCFTDPYNRRDVAGRGR
jgi:hypothetical protein